MATVIPRIIPPPSYRSDSVDGVDGDGVHDGDGGADGADGGDRCLGSMLRGCTRRTSVGTKNLDWDPTRRRKTYGSSEYILYASLNNIIDTIA